MKQILRFSISGTIGFIITAALFIGMLNLLSHKKVSATSADTNINFSFVKDFKEPEVKPPNTPDKPIQEIVKQPPAAPKLNVDAIPSPEVNIPLPTTKGKAFNLHQEIALPSINKGGGFGTDNPGTLKAAIPPIYPQKPLINKTEGWVKVQISVNEFGSVSTVTILDAEPARVFNNAAKKAVKKWKFHPKTVDGNAQSFIATQTIEFKLEQ